ncbi:MAG TPA: hypothetical protein EYP21_05760 [Syntrophaceae bacterium]|nr:hypothetical protein [Syntrophaceae bacterium]
MKERNLRYNHLIAECLVIALVATLLVSLTPWCKRIPIFSEPAFAQGKLEIFWDRRARFSISYPSSWHIITGEETQSLVKKSVDEYDLFESLKEEIRQSPGPRVYIFKEPMGAGVEFNPNINVLVQEVPANIVVPTGQVLIDHLKNSLEMYLKGFNLISAKEITLHSLPAVVLDYTYKMPIGDKEQSLRSLQYNIIVKNRFMYTLSATDMVSNFRKNKAEFESILNSFQFK